MSATARAHRKTPDPGDAPGHAGMVLPGDFPGGELPWWPIDPRHLRGQGGDAESRRTRRLLLGLAVLVLGALAAAAILVAEAPGPAFSAAARACLPDQADYRVQLEIDAGAPATRLPPEFLSFSIDTAQLVGGLWWNEAASGRESGRGSVPTPPLDLARPRLRELARALAPAWLRVGGSEADLVWYDLPAPDGRAAGDGAGGPGSAAGPDRPPGPPPGYRSVLDARRWDELQAFAAETGLRLDFTLNAGPGPRRDGVWQDGNARSLLAYSRVRGHRVDAWEFGNELNGFWAVHGLGSVVSQEQYCRDFAAFAALVRQESPGSLAIMQGSAFWPVLGEAFGFAWAFLDSRTAGVGALSDRVNWHYYPQQSRRAPVASRRAGPRVLLDPAALDEAAVWAGRVRAWRDRWAPGRPVWLGETGNAQFGGEPGLSDGWLGSLWWLDELGLMAANDVQCVVRQCLIGQNYGLLDGATLAPRPDFWASWLWKRFMGPDVYRTLVRSQGDGDWTGGQASRLRAYAHADPDSGRTGQGAYTLLLVNLDEHRSASVRLADARSRSVRVWQASSPDILGQAVELNGQRLELAAGETLPAAREAAGQGADAWGAGPLMPGLPAGMVLEPGRPLRVRPLSYAFVRVGPADGASQPAISCQGD